jgi:hypothetical protein
MSCQHFGTRKTHGPGSQDTQDWANEYVYRDDLNQMGDWNASDSVFGANYNQTPPLTATYKTFADRGPDYSNWLNNGGSQGNCSPEMSDYPGTQFVACGDCRGGDPNWKFCNCCVSKWNPDNLTYCCDPGTNDYYTNPIIKQLQNDPVSCDPSWCPFSASCEQAASTGTYCAENFDDPQCYKICMKYIDPKNISNRPNWCDTFMVKYCAEHNNDSLQDQNTCACSLHKTDADECILSSCSSGIGVWMSGTQLARVANCGTICEQNIVAVKNHDVNIDQNQFILQCGNGQTTYCNSSSPPVCISMNSSAGPSSGLPGNGTNSQGLPYTNWWGSYTAVQNSNGTVSHQLQLSPMGIISVITLCLVIIVVIALVIMNNRQTKFMELVKSQNTVLPM